jgi:hypothetical protein
MEAWSGQEVAASSRAGAICAFMCEMCAGRVSAFATACLLIAAHAIRRDDSCGHADAPNPVIPAKAGIHFAFGVPDAEQIKQGRIKMGPGLRRDDGGEVALLDRAKPPC